MRLRNLQLSFQEYIFTQENENIKSEIIGHADIYADAYEARLLEAMEKTFVLLREKLGEEKFDDLCIGYLIENPSHYFSIGRIGEKFSEFLKKYNPEYAETAALDWALHRAVDAADAKPLSKEFLQNIPEDKWADIIFELHPSFSLLKKYRVWRKNIQVYYLMITEIEYIFLKSLQEKLSFGEVCEKLAEIMPEESVVNYAIQQLLDWLQDELITGVKFTHELA